MKAPRALLPLLAVAALATAGCGGGGYVDVYDPIYYGEVEVDNATDASGAFEDVLGFYLAPAPSGAFTGNLLGGPLPPGFVEYVGDFEEGYWDAEADLEFGDLVTWFDVFVPADDVTTFEVF